ncbi:MAG TPA: PqqD family protein [Chloroflexota bacterium]|nr:PqqD family protein [Chloroflexota bacterium]
MIVATSRPLRNQNVLARPGESALILLNPRNGEYYTLDEVGGQIWNLCDGSHTVAEMVAAISVEFDAPVSEIETDVHELLSDLASEQLVVEAG